MSKKINFAQHIKGMVSIVNPPAAVLFHDVILPKQKRKYSPRKQSSTPRKHLEKDLEVSVIKRLRLYGAVCGRVKTMGRMVRGKYISDPYLFIGFPDVVCFYKNQLWFLEIKSPTGKFDNDGAQGQFRKLCLAAGINHIIVRNITDIEIILKNPLTQQHDDDIVSLQKGGDEND